MLKTCRQCGNTIPENDDFCGKCGTPYIADSENYCSNPNCERFKQPLNDALQEFCGKCGKPTVFGNKIEKLL